MKEHIRKKAKKNDILTRAMCAHAVVQMHFVYTRY